jgi:3-hydroxymyristoyl/3-hydroxydecanoyl-(acyl carrier protein) dehydratase
MTNGSMRKVLGERYAALDSYEKRARLPSPPFMFVGRVMELDAQFGQFRPSRIVTEFTVEDDCVLLMSKNTISYVMLTEASQSAILLLAYIGIDIVSEGSLRYRILDTTVRSHGDFPIRGEAVIGVLEFESFAKNGKNMLIKSKFACYRNGELVMSMNLTGGFFTEQELATRKGVLPSIKTAAKKAAERTARERQPQPQPDAQDLHARQPVQELDAHEPHTQPPVPERQPQLAAMAPPDVQPRSPASSRPVCGPAADIDGFYDGKYGPSLYATRDASAAESFFVDPRARMADRIVSIDFSGGDYGFGRIVAEKKIDGAHWAFSAHFKNDPVFPGSLIVEAFNHLQILFALSAGYIGDKSCYIGGYGALPVRTIFRGQVRRMESTIRFEQNFKRVAKIDGKTVILSDCDAYWQGVHIFRMEDISMSIDARDADLQKSGMDEEPMRRRGAGAQGQRA